MYPQKMCGQGKLKICVLPSFSVSIRFYFYASFEGNRFADMQCYILVAADSKNTCVRRLRSSRSTLQPWDVKPAIGNVWKKFKCDASDGPAMVHLLHFGNLKQ